MSILPKSMTVYITFECDECGEELDTGTRDFGEAIAELKAEGWRFEKDEQDEWCHYCRGCQS